ncbi:MAG: SDR family oxidoreductase [Gammaproteobacteria bacterium]|jgi:NAD(P)-dependent dehydrogenase (short-subunit alcohol dehydrogenase family)|nr:SDR family oxidoreductase [Gammaproteobacteria bacterium]
MKLGISGCIAIACLGMLAVAGTGFAQPAPDAEHRNSAGTVLITGANRGLGFHFAEQFAAGGWQVIATTRRPEQAQALRDLADKYPNLVVEKLDITDDAEIASLAEHYADQPIDVLLNNAARLGELSRQNFGALDFELFAEILHTNVVGTLKVTQALLPNVTMSAQKKVVVMGSAAGSNALGHDAPNLYAYRASKAALHFATRHLAMEQQPRGVTVILLEPGFADSRGIMQMNPADAPDQETRELAEMVQKLGARMRDPAESVAGMIEVIRSVTIEQTGQFLLFDGSQLPL